MHPTRLLACLESDYRRLESVAADRLSAKVPSCPEWTVRDLVEHVALVYLHKVACMRLGRFPESWPPEPTGEPAMERLARAYAELTAEFAGRAPSDPAATFHPDDQTVGFWIRRMAQETAVHRVDAELAAGDPTPVDGELAIDGIDEVLVMFLGWGIGKWSGEPAIADLLSGADGRHAEIRSGGESFLVRPTHAGVDVLRSAGDDRIADRALTVNGDPSAVLLWLWGRLDDSAVQIDGDPAFRTRLRDLLAQAQ